ncbi:hypothetical protein A9Q84_02275 [Halobacteriovorax marinus]|uniref:histidine kinase n=1 Tax=Halobacteriovorax marinus TaxID=97084 RepID=A0A1Y5FGH9_9BACT|nr:hypothetical protein A9Q84_02275 [Halobacteriovorax marinus]
MSHIDNKDKFEFFLNHLEDHIYEIDHHGKVIFYSKHFEEQTSKNLVNCYLQNLLPVSSQMDLITSLQKVTTSLSTYNFNFQKNSKHYNLALIPILDSEHVLCVIRNISELYKLQENALRDEAKLFEVAKMFKLGFWEYDLKNKVINCSKELREIHEIPTHIEVNEDYWINSISKDTKILYVTKFEECFKSGYFEFSHEIETYSKKRKFLKSVGRAITDEKGQPVSIVGSLLDMTEQKIEVENNCEIDKMASIGRMAGSIGHEINNPLAIISGYAQKLKRLSKDENLSSEQLLNYAQKIEKTTMRIKKIVDSLSKVSRKSDDSDIQNISLASIIEDTLILCQEKFKNEGIYVDSNHLETFACLKTNPVEISQIFLNLLNNSYDAISHLKEKWIKIIIEVGTKEASIKVLDSGTGIPIELHKKILEPFYTTKPFGKGTGLGLSISGSIAEKYGGNLSIDETCPNTCFKVTLPVNWHTPHGIFLAGGFIPSKHIKSTKSLSS